MTDAELAPPRQMASERMRRCAGNCGFLERNWLLGNYA
jgi:hypothetical protein